MSKVNSKYIWADLTSKYKKSEVGGVIFWRHWSVSQTGPKIPPKLITTDECMI